MRLTGSNLRSVLYAVYDLLEGVSAIDIRQGAVSREVIKDNSGNQAYYTMKYKPGRQGKGGEIEFTPEPNSLKRFFGKGFAVITVKESYSGRGGESVEFPLKATESLAIGGK